MSCSDGPALLAAVAGTWRSPTALVWLNVDEPLVTLA